MEHDSSRNGYHEPEPGFAGQEKADDWGDDFPKTFSVNLIGPKLTDKDGRPGASGSTAACLASAGGYETFQGAHRLSPGDHGTQDMGVTEREVPSAANRDNIVVSHNPQYLALAPRSSPIWMRRSTSRGRRPFPTTGLTAARSG